MRFCFISGVFKSAGAGAFACVLGTLSGFILNAAELTGGRATVVVRADAKSGRLVRSVIVTPRTVVPRNVNAQSAPPAAATRAGESVREIVEREARANDVDPLLVHSLVQVESNYNPYAISPKGAEGVMQLIPSTARRLGVKNPFDAEENIRAGVRHLKQLQERFKDDRLALAAYNAGEGAVQRYGWIPPYPETQNYVYQIGKRYGQARRPATSNKPASLQPRAEAAAAEEPQYAPVETFTDAEGRIHLRTR